MTAALAAAADTQRPLTRRGRGRSVALATAMTKEGLLRADAKLARSVVSETITDTGWPGTSISKHRYSGADIPIRSAAGPQASGQRHGAGERRGRARPRAGISGASRR